MAEAQRVDPGGPVERGGDRRPPVDDDRVVRIVFDVSPADVPPVGVLVGDPAEEVSGSGALQVFQRFGDRHLDVLRRDLVGRRGRIDGAEAPDHRVATPSGERQVIAFDLELREQVCIHGVANSK